MHTAMVRGISLDRHVVGLGGRVTLAVDLVQQLYAQTQANPKECISVKKSIRKTNKRLAKRVENNEKDCHSVCDSQYSNIRIMKNRKSLLKYGNVIFWVKVLDDLIIELNPLTF